jgi:hypothetical protein
VDINLWQGHRPGTTVWDLHDEFRYLGAPRAERTKSKEWRGTSCHYLLESLSALVAKVFGRADWDEWRRNMNIYSTNKIYNKERKKSSGICRNRYVIEELGEVEVRRSRYMTVWEGEGETSKGARWWRLKSEHRFGL